MKEINLWLIGHYNYYGISGNMVEIRKFYILYPRYGDVFLGSRMPELGTFGSTKGIKKQEIIKDVYSQNNSISIPHR